MRDLRTAIGEDDLHRLEKTLDGPIVTEIGRATDLLATIAGVGAVVEIGVVVKAGAEVTVGGEIARLI